MKKDCFLGFICAFVIAFTTVCIAHCKSEPIPVCPALSGTVAERDSMIACLKEFDEVFSFADTVCEDEERETAINDFESYMSKDTVNINVARSLYQAVAKEIEHVVHLQLDEDEDSEASLFDGEWHEFNQHYIDLK